MKNISNNGEKSIQTTWNYCTVTQHKHISCEILAFYSQNFVKKLYVMDKSGYDFRIQRAEIDKEDKKYFKQLNHCRPVWSAHETRRKRRKKKMEYG
jgi:hypothetical protein